MEAKHSTSFSSIKQSACWSWRTSCALEWWYNHGCEGGRYGDDGEMQCCGLDFKRTPFDELRKRVKDLRLLNNLRAAANREGEK
jgi:hypothetical protein